MAAKIRPDGVPTPDYVAKKLNETNPEEFKNGNLAACLANQKALKEHIDRFSDEGEKATEVFQDENGKLSIVTAEEKAKLEHTGPKEKPVKSALSDK